jgi:hypothetical protein
MYDSRFSFYRGKEWRDLLQQLKQERVNADGQIICEYCGKPIIKAYDMIGHHNIELDEENVNNYDISLNPNNISLVHHRCHNYIHNKLGYSIRQVFIVYGAPLSGKTTFVKDNANEGDLIIDIDSIWQCVSGLPRYNKPNRLKAIVFKVRDSLIECVKYRYGKWDNCYIIGGYPLQSERERLIKELGAREVFINASQSECMARLESIDDGRDHDEWARYIADWFARYTPPEAEQ